MVSFVSIFEKTYCYLPIEKWTSLETCSRSPQKGRVRRFESDTYQFLSLDFETSCLVAMRDKANNRVRITSSGKETDTILNRNGYQIPLMEKDLGGIFDQYANLAVKDDNRKRGVQTPV